MACLKASKLVEVRFQSGFWIQMSTFCKNISCIGLRPVLMTLLCSQNYGFSRSHVWMWELGYKESWAPKNWCFWTVVLKKTLENPLDCKEIQPVHPKGNQSWIFSGGTDAEAPILWSPDANSWLIGKDPDAGKDWRQKEKGTTQIRWLNGITDSMGMSLS